MLRKHLLFISTIITQLAFGQSESTNSTISLYEKIPTSPNVGSLGRYFDVPVNMATGLPNIEIPLYAIKSGNIVIPITLKYHAGGVKVNELASWVGTNWNLDAGGSITKQVNGLDDFYATEAATIGNSGNPQYNYIEPDYSAYTNFGFTSMTQAVDSFKNLPFNGQVLDNIHRFFGNIIKGGIDGEADQFFYSTPEGGGSFFYNQKLQKFQTDKINGWKVSTVDGSTWALTSNNGKIFGFSSVELTKNPNTQSMKQYLTTAWMLDNIIDLKTNKEVNFSYQKDNLISHVGITMYKDFKPNGSALEYFRSNSETIIREGDVYSLKDISFDEGTVKFIMDAVSRQDGGTKALKEIQILNRDSVLLKKFVFNYFYTTANLSTCHSGYQTNKRLFLQSIEEINYSLTGTPYPQNPYIFSYDTTIIPPCRLSYAQDLWGYYNGRHSNTTFIPTPYGHVAEPSYPILQAADRSIDTIYTKAGILKEITYPTRGKLSFEFENNRVDTGFVGGLRIKKIINTDHLTNKSLITEYSYPTINNLSSGQVLYSPVYYYDFTYIAGGANVFSCIRTESEPINSLFPNQGSPILYSIVERRQKGGDEELLSKHYFNNYGNLNSYYADLYHNNENIAVPHKKYVSIGNYLGRETASELYKKNSNNTFTLIQSQTHEYEILNEFKNYIWNVQGAWTSIITFGYTEWDGNDPYSTIPMNTYPSLHCYKHFQDELVKTKTTTTSYEGSSTIEANVFYKYDTANGNLKEVKAVNSLGDTSITKIKYPTDYQSIENGTGINASIWDLTYQNCLSSPIETTKEYKKKNATGSTLIEAVLIEYNSLRTKKVKKVDEDISYSSFTQSYNNTSGFVADSRYRLMEEVLSFSPYGKPLTIEANGNLTSYIWDGKKDEPIAVAQNTQSSDVAYTSFDGVENGNWNVGSSVRDNSNRINGQYGYQLSNGNITKSSLSTSKNYTLTYWSNNGSYTVSSSASTTELASLGTWKLFSHKITGASSVTISGTGIIDELRLYPEKARMNSFVFTPLLGVSSVSDEKSLLIHYEYTGIGRLHLVKDQHKNILKKICYNYYGQPENCVLVGNSLQTASFTRNNCGAGYSGSSVNYSIPTNSFFGATQTQADSLASASLYATGQSYANQNGTCTQVTIYAKLFYENVSYGSAGSYGDVVIRFYSDQACTQSLSVSNLSVIVQEEIYNCISSSSSASNTPYTISGESETILYGVSFEYSDAFTCTLLNYYLQNGTGYTVVQ
jgi:hypothetical protein